MRKDEWSIAQIKAKIKTDGWNRGTLVRNLRGHHFGSSVWLLERLNRRFKRSGNERDILWLKHRTAEDIIRFVHWYGDIPPAPFILKTVSTWIKESEKEYLIDLGKALAGQRLPKTERRPYILIKHEYDFWMFSKDVQPNNALLRANEVLLMISEAYDMKFKEFQKFVCEREDLTSYLSPFAKNRGYGKKEGVHGQAVVWDVVERFKRECADENPFSGASKRLNFSEATTRRYYIEARKMKGLHTKSPGGKSLSDKERIEEARKYVQAILNPPVDSP